ncbi:MAG: hypothetical protein ACYDBX_00915 [Patescibacteria group bacterium]
MPYIKRRYLFEIYKELFVIYHNKNEDVIINSLMDYVSTNKELLNNFAGELNKGFFIFKKDKYYWVSKARILGLRYKHSIYIYKIDFPYKENVKYLKLSKYVSILDKYRLVPVFRNNLYSDKANLCQFKSYEFYKDLLKLASNKYIKEILDKGLEDSVSLMSFYKFPNDICNLYYLQSPGDRINFINEFLKLDFNITYDWLITTIIGDIVELASVKKYVEISHTLLVKLLDKIKDNLYIFSDTQIVTYKDSFNKKTNNKIYDYINNKVDLYSQIDSGGFVGLLDRDNFFVSKYYKPKIKKILIVSEDDDAHVDKVISFIDKEKFHIDIIGMKSIEESGYVETKSAIIGEFFDTEERHERVYDICWWRKPQYLSQSEQYLKNLNLSNMAEVEKMNFLKGTVLNIPIKNWVNHILDIEKAQYKIHQLKIASNYLNVPDTVITNKREIIKKIFNDKFIMKSIRSQNFGLDKGVLKTTLTTVDDIDRIDLNFAPVLIQEYIKKECDIRVTIIGDKVFSAKIFSHSEKSMVDFRSDYQNLTHEEYKLPDYIEVALLKLNKYYNLNYSAIDLIQDKNGKIYFLELNPNGQYLWIENELGLPISESIASFITR